MAMPEAHAPVYYGDGQQDGHERRGERPAPDASLPQSAIFTESSLALLLLRISSFLLALARAVDAWPPTPIWRAHTLHTATHHGLSAST